MNSEFLFRYSSLNFRHDFFRQVLGNFLILPEVHGKAAPALRARAQLGGIAEHFRQRNHGLNKLRGAPNFGAFQTAAPGTKIAVDGAHVLFRHHYFNAHYRLEQHRLGSPAGFLEADGTADLERHFRRIDVVIIAVEEFDFDIHHWIAGQNAAFQRLADALLNCRNKFLGHRTALDDVVELEALGVIRLHPQLGAG